MWYTTASILTVLLLPITIVTGTQPPSVTDAKTSAASLAYSITYVPGSAQVLVNGRLEISRPDTVRFNVVDAIGHRPINAIRNFVVSDGAQASISFDTSAASKWSIASTGKRLAFSYSIDLDSLSASLPPGNTWAGALPHGDDRLLFMSKYGYVYPANIEVAGSVAVDWILPPDWTVHDPWLQDSQEQSVQNTNTTTTTAPNLGQLLRNYAVATSSAEVISTSVGNVALNIVWTGSEQIRQTLDAENALTQIVRSSIDVMGDERFSSDLLVVLHDTGESNSAISATAGASSIQFQLPHGMPFGTYWAYSSESLQGMLAHEIVHTIGYSPLKDKLASTEIRDTSGPSEWPGGDQSELCWMREGFTEYFARLILVDSGLIDVHSLLKDVQHASDGADLLDESESLTLESACAEFFDDRRAQSFVYNKGMAVAFAMDMELRRWSDGNKSLEQFVARYAPHPETTPTSLQNLLLAWDVYAPSESTNYLERLGEVDLLDVRSLLAELGCIQFAQDHESKLSWYAPPYSVVGRLFTEAL